MLIFLLTAWNCASILLKPNMRSQMLSQLWVFCFLPCHFWPGLCRHLIVPFEGSDRHNNHIKLIRGCSWWSIIWIHVIGSPWAIVFSRREEMGHESKIRGNMAKWRRNRSTKVRASIICLDDYIWLDHLVLLHLSHFRGGESGGSMRPIPHSPSPSCRRILTKTAPILSS